MGMKKDAGYVPPKQPAKPDDKGFVPPKPPAKPPATPKK